jgi:hypothetical protein
MTGRLVPAVKASVYSPSNRVLTETELGRKGGVRLWNSPPWGTGGSADPEFGPIIHLPPYRKLEVLQQCKTSIKLLHDFAGGMVTRMSRRRP